MLAPRQAQARRDKSVARVGSGPVKWLLLCGKRKCSAACKHFHLLSLSLLFLWRLSSSVSCTFKCKILNYDGSCFSINMASVKSRQQLEPIVVMHDNNSKKIEQAGKCETKAKSREQRAKGSCEWVKPGKLCINYTWSARGAAT